MKRSHSSDHDDEERGRITTTNTSSTTSRAATRLNKVRKDASHRKHQLRTGADSAQEYMKSEWTSDELDLDKDLQPLTAFVGDNLKFVDEIFSILSQEEFKRFTPDILKDLSVSQLKELCLEELKSIPAEKMKFICEGNKPEDFEKLKADEANTRSNYHNPEIPNTSNKSDDIQLSVDDNEYSDFLGAEDIQSKPPTKHAEVQSNESSLASSSSEEEISDDNKEGEGWVDIFSKTQMEILELEMRAKAIRALMKAQQFEEMHNKKD